MQPLIGKAISSVFWFCGSTSLVYQQLCVCECGICKHGITGGVEPDTRTLSGVSWQHCLFLLPAPILSWHKSNKMRGEIMNREEWLATILQGEKVYWSFLASFFYIFTHCWPIDSFVLCLEIKLSHFQWHGESDQWTETMKMFTGVRCVWHKLKGDWLWLSCLSFWYCWPYLWALWQFLKVLCYCIQLFREHITKFQRKHLLEARTQQWAILIPKHLLSTLGYSPYWSLAFVAKFRDRKE